MVLNGVKETFEGLYNLGFYPNPSSFILCRCDKKKDKLEMNQVIPLENNLCNIQIDKENMVLTDLEGNILIRFDNSKINETEIMFVNGDDLLLGFFTKIVPNFIPKKIYNHIKHYHYDKSLNKENDIFDISEGRLEKFDFINNNTILLELCENRMINHSRLYSISKRDFITPNFRKLENVENTNYNIFKFTDVVKSSLEINGIRHNSKIIGFVTIDGKFYNGVYDELTNKEIECELNSKPDFEEYNELKKMIQGKLNEKVVKESNKLVTKDFIIKKLENKAKRDYNKK